MGAGGDSIRENGATKPINFPVKSVDSGHILLLTVLNPTSGELVRSTSFLHKIYDKRRRPDRCINCNTAYYQHSKEDFIHSIQLNVNFVHLRFISFILRRMFCCVRKPAHYGQIVTGICLENQCIQSENQLCCIECATHEHENHEIISIKNYIPELLKAQKQKLSYMQELKNLLTFVNDECENQQSLLTFGGASQLSVMNIVEACKVMIKDLKSKKDQDQKKIKDIQKTLQIKGMKSNSPVKSQINFHERKASEGFYSAVRMGSESPNFKSNFHHLPASISQLGFDPVDTFSHTLKHPYISVTSDSRSITKSSAVNGYKLACLSASKLHDSESLQPILVKVKVDKSSGHLMLGLAHAENVKEKQYMNCYGIGQGSYIIGQNGNDPKSAILFHHSNSMYNRKEIVGWNYKEGDVLGIGIMKQNGVSFAVFRKFVIEKGKLDLKKVDKQYTMPIMNPQKQQALGPLYLLVLLQNMNDQVSILPEEE